MKRLKINLIYGAVVNRKEYKDIFVVEYNNKREYLLDITTGQPIKTDVSIGIVVNESLDKEIYNGKHEDVDFKEITKVYLYKKEKLILIHGANGKDIYIDYINNKIYSNIKLDNKKDYILIYEPNIFNDKLDRHILNEEFYTKVKIMDKNVFVRSFDSKDLGVCISICDCNKLVNNIEDIFNYFDNKILNEIKNELAEKKINYSMVEYK